MKNNLTIKTRNSFRKHLMTQIIVIHISSETRKTNTTENQKPTLTLNLDNYNAPSPGIKMVVFSILGNIESKGCDKHSWGVWGHAVSAPTGVQGWSPWKLWLFSLSNNAKPSNSAEFLCTYHAVSLLCFLQNFIASSKLFHPFCFQHADLLIPWI